VCTEVHQQFFLSLSFFYRIQSCSSEINALMISGESASERSFLMMTVEIQRKEKRDVPQHVDESTEIKKTFLTNYG
jgi:hypothetical protein